VFADLSDVVGREHGRFFTNYTGEKKWVAVSLLSNAPICPCYYALRNSYISGYSLRNWQLQGSTDGHHWDVLSFHVDDQTIQAISYGYAWPVKGATKYYSNFRIYSTGLQEDYSSMMGIGGFEVYGKVSSSQAKNACARNLMMHAKTSQTHSDNNCSEKTNCILG
jgi:hypothetical protein